MVTSGRGGVASRLERGRSFQSIRDVHDNFDRVDDISDKVSVGIPAKKTLSVDYIAWTIGILSISLFIPLIAGADFHLDNSQIEISARAFECRAFAIASLSVCLSLMIDLSLDIFFSQKAAYLYLRGFSLFALTFYSLAYIVASNYDNFGELEVVLGAVQLFGELSTTIWFLHKLDSLNCWSPLSGYTIIGLYYFQFMTWFLNYIYFEGDTRTIVYSLSNACFYFAAAIIVGQCVYWFYLLHKAFGARGSDKISLPINILYSNVVIAVLITFGIMKLILRPVVKDITGVQDDYDVVSSVEYFDGNLLLRTGFTYFLCLLPGPPRRTMARR